MTDKMPEVIWASRRPQDVGDRWTGPHKSYDDQIKYIRADTVEGNHCHDCCCARCWKALGITEYTGKSIPEHIQEIKHLLEESREALFSWDEDFAPFPAEYSYLIDKIDKFLDGE